MTADQWAAMALLAAIWAASVVWCWLEYRRGPVDPPWADPFIDHIDDLRGDFDWPAGYPKLGDRLAAECAAVLMPEVLAEAEALTKGAVS